MKILLTASECSPLVKVGGIADVIGSLPIAIKELGIDIRLAIPFYKPLEDEISKNNSLDIKLIKEITVDYDNQPRKTLIYQTLLPNTDVIVYLIKNSDYITNGGIYYTSQQVASNATELDRFAFFSKALASVFSYPNDIFTPDIFHCNDWHTGMIPQLIQNSHKYGGAPCPKTIFTIHNLAYQGFSKLDIADKLGLTISDDQTLSWDATDDNLDFILQGIVGSDYVTTVSKKYAGEIQTQEFGEGLNDILTSRRNRLIGILNGISYEIFNPSKDPYISVQYTNADWQQGKQKNKQKLLKDLGLQDSTNKPLIGIVSRLAGQKGLDLVSGSIEQIVEMGYQIVILGTGDPQLESILAEKNNNPAISTNYTALIEFSEKLARNIYAASDMFLIPSRYEPSGLTQMIAMKYGSVPVVRATGGLFDTVQDDFTGFTFDKFTKEDMLHTLSRAIDEYHNKEKWNKYVQNCLNQDFSWNTSAREYAKLYQKVLNLS